MAKKNELFDIINSIFTVADLNSMYTDTALAQSAFMINRRMAIQYPLQANVLNINGTNGLDLVKFWGSFLYTGSKYPPKWIYTAGGKKSKANADSKATVTNTVIEEYCKWYKLSIKDVKFALSVFNDDMVSDIKDFEKNILSNI